MKKCPYCAGEIQDEAVFCRYCDSVLSKPLFFNDHTFRKRVYIGGGIFIVLASSILLFTLSSGKNRVKRLAEESVINILQSPSTAKVVASKIIYEKNGQYVVKLMVDAQNAFGASLRKGFIV